MVEWNLGGQQGGGRFGTEPLWLAQRQNSDRVRDLAALHLQY